MKKIIPLFIVLGICLIFLPRALAGLDDGLVAYYPFNGNANDESGNGNHGTVHGGATLISDRFGNTNSAYRFNSDQGYISVNTSDISLVGTSFTISVWVRIDNYSVDYRAFIRRGNHANYELYVRNTKLHFGYTAHPPPNYDPNQISGTTDIGLNEWVFVAALYDRDLGMTKLYVNGELDGNNPNALDPHNPGGPLEIGNWYGTRNWWNYPTFTGDIDNIRIYNRALSEDEILALYAEEELPIHDDFDGLLDPRWTVKLGHAWTDGGWVYIQNNGDPHRDGFILTGEGADWGDYRIVTRFFTETWPYRGTVCFRVQECSGWCFWSGTATMYGLMLSTLDGALRLDKRFGQQIEDSIVGLVVLYPPDGVIHDQDNILEIEVVGGNIKVAINGVDVLDYTDPDPILTGGVGLASTWEGTTRFDYITIEDVRPNLPPTCQAKLINPGYGELKVRDDGGLAEINIVNDRNAELVIPPFTPGTTDPVLVTASKIVPDDSWSVAIEAVDVHGNSITCDPMITLQIREKGKPVSVTITEADGILPEDIYVSVQNGDPGIKNLEIIVNGEKFKVTGLGDNEETTIDILSAMLDADNSITLTAKGKPNTSATVVIHDGSMQF